MKVLPQCSLHHCPRPPNNDFSRTTEGRQKPADMISGSGHQPAVNLIASVLMFDGRRTDKSPLFLFEIWGSGYLFLVEQIHRCPHRLTVQLWYVLWAVALPLRGGTGSENILHFLVNEWKNFSSFADKTTPSHRVCPLFRDLPIHCLYVSLKPLQGHERVFLMSWCDLRGFWCAQLCLTSLQKRPFYDNCN